jgi:lipoprotein-releasing system permease protein
MEKTKEIGILKSLGAQNWSIMFIFMTEGLIIGLVGTLLGCVLGILGCLLIKIFNFSLPGGGEVYYITHLPVKMVLSQIVLVVVTSISISFLSTFYPAINAARLNPALTLRYE